jgi:hypothetical protein
MKNLVTPKKSQHSINLEEDSSPKKSKPSNFLNFDSGKSTFESFLGNHIDLDTFNQEYWEKKPLFIERNDEEKCKDWLDYTKSLFSLDILKKIISTSQLKYGKDLNLCKLIKEKKTNLNKSGSVKLEYVVKCFEKESATIQFHQPQRFT